jgi:putative DNA primase/helicase
MTEDIDYVNCLYTLLAHGFTNDNSIKLIIFFIGEGDNGKSALMNLVKLILQDFICSDASKAILKKGNSCLDTELVMLIGKRVATLSELRKEDNLDINRVKNISGDDKNIMLRPNANSSQIPTIIDCKIMIPTNEMPTIPQKDSALLKRFGCFNFCNTFERSSEKLKEIMSMRNHVFTYLCTLASKLTLNKFQFSMCHQMLSYTSEIKSSIDTVKGFVNDMIDFTDKHSDYITAFELYNAYKSYCEERGFTSHDILNNLTFGKKITKDYNLKDKKGPKKISKITKDCYFCIKKKIVIVIDNDSDIGEQIPNEMGGPGDEQIPNETEEPKDEYRDDSDTSECIPTGTPDM